jgi:hypothetical protein
MSGDIHVPHFLFKVIMSKFTSWVSKKWSALEDRSLKAIDSAHFYSALFTERQKFYMVVIIMAIIAAIGARGAVEFIAFVYVMNKITPDEDQK